jgi:PAS domain S-box-containing protein
MIIIDLVYKLSLLVALCALSGLIDPRYDRKGLPGKILQGILFGITAIVGIMDPFILEKGLFFDGRTIVVSLGTLFFGPLAGIIAAAFAAIFRLSIGGIGTVMGLLSIFSSYLIGIFFYYKRKGSFVYAIANLQLFLFGIIVHLAMMLSILALPYRLIIESYSTMSFTVMGIYPVISFIIGKLLSSQEQNKIAFYTIQKISEQRLIKEKELIISETRYRRLFETAKDGILILDAQNGTIIDVNPFMIEMLGYSYNQFIGKAIWELGSFKDSKLNRENFLELQKKEYIRYEELPLKTINGQLIDVEFISNVYFVDDKKVIQCNIRNIAERKLAEEALRESETRFRSLFENVIIGLYRTHPDGTIILANKTLVEMLGYSSFEKLAERNLEKEGFDSSYERKKFLDQIEKDGEVNNYESVWIQQDGTTIFVRENTRAIRDSQGKTLYYDGMVENITDRKRTEEALKESEERFRSVAHSANDAIITADKKGIILGWNLGAEKIFGYKGTEIIGKDLRTIVPQGYREQHVNSMKRIEEDGEYYVVGRTVELYGVHKNGREFPLELSLAVWETKKGRFFTGIIRDITERKQSEEEIKKRNEQLIKLNAEKDKFFSIIAHDLKSPFNGFLNLTELMADSTEEFSPTELIENNKLLNESARNLYRLLENLLEWAQIQKGSIIFTPKESDLFKMVSQSIGIVYHQALQKRITIINEINNPLKVYADEKMIDTVLRNLISNAVKFTRKDGKIIIKSQRSDNGTIEISIADNGVGIPENDVKRLFKIEEKVSSQGTDGESSTGLGLLLCKEFVEKHGGNIWVESEPGRGSTFTFSLPKII